MPGVAPGSRLLLGLFFTLALARAGPPRLARAESQRFLAVGGGISGVAGRTPGFHQALEVTVGWLRKQAAGEEILIPGLVTVAFSAGTTIRAGDLGYTYGEIGSFVPALAFLGPSLALGAGRFAEPGRPAEPALHAFVGLTLPLRIPDLGSSRSDTPLPYLEAYYRPQVSLSSARSAHELGLMLKVLFMGPLR